MTTVSISMTANLIVVIAILIGASVLANASAILDMLR